MASCKTLCWKCANCTSVDKCEFVKNIDKYYRTNKNKFTKTGKIELIKDLQKYYIKGTKIDGKGNIVFCPCFVSDGLNYLTEFQQLKTFVGDGVLIRHGKKLFDVLSEYISNLTEEEKQNKYKNFIDKVEAKKKNKKTTKAKKINNKDLKKTTKTKAKYYCKTFSRNGKIYTYYYDRITHKRV